MSIEISKHKIKAPLGKVMYPAQWVDEKGEKVYIL